MKLSKLNLFQCLDFKDESNKKKIIKKISSGIDIDRRKSKDVLDMFLNMIKENSKLKKIQISDLELFINIKHQKRIGRNPKTKESYIIYPSEKINFKASNKVKGDLN